MESHKASDNPSTSNEVMSLQRQLCFRGIKLFNRGGQNNCYVNASVNGLLASDEIRNIISNSQLEDLLIKILQNVLPDQVHTVQNLKGIVNPEKFDNNRQHDASEFIEEMLQKLKMIIPNLNLIS